MISAPELLALLDEAADYVVTRTYVGLPIDPKSERMRQLMIALAELPAVPQISAVELMSRRQAPRLRFISDAKEMR